MSERLTASPVENQSGNVNPTRESFFETRDELEQVKTSRRARLARKVMGLVTGNAEYVTKKEASLNNQLSDMKNDLAPSEAVLDEAYATNDFKDSRKDEIRLNHAKNDAYDAQAQLNRDIELKRVTDPEIISLRQNQVNAHVNRVNAEMGDALSLNNQSAHAIQEAQMRQIGDEVDKSRHAA